MSQWDITDKRNVNGLMEIDFFSLVPIHTIVKKLDFLTKMVVLSTKEGSIGIIHIQNPYPLLYKEIHIVIKTNHHILIATIDKVCYNRFSNIIENF